jgi:hypothetical protein
MKRNTFRYILLLMAICLIGAQTMLAAFNKEGTAKRRNKPDNVINLCLADNNSGDDVFFSPKGFYTFNSCRTATTVTLSGNGVVATINGNLVITDSKPDRRVDIVFLQNQGTGHATVTLISPGGPFRTFTINSTLVPAECSCGNRT